MHPTEIIELISIGGLLIFIFIITIFVKANLRKYGWILTALILTTYCMFYLLRPYWIDYQISRKVVILESYLEQQYPIDEWTITTVPHRENDYKHVNPYYIGITFDKEPDVTYHYWVDKRDIYQISYSTNKSHATLKYREDE